MMWRWNWIDFSLPLVDTINIDHCSCYNTIRLMAMPAMVMACILCQAFDHRVLLDQWHGYCGVDVATFVYSLQLKKKNWWKNLIENSHYWLLLVEFDGCIALNQTLDAHLKQNDNWVETSRTQKIIASVLSLTMMVIVCLWQINKRMVLTMASFGHIVFENGEKVVNNKSCAKTQFINALDNCHKRNWSLTNRQSLRYHFRSFFSHFASFEVAVTVDGIDQPFIYFFAFVSHWLFSTYALLIVARVYHTGKQKVSLCCGKIQNK